MLETLLLIQLIACAAMTGIIWIVQVAIYPLFSRITPENFDSYHSHYTKQVTYIIAPLMFLEASTCATCLFLGNWQDHLIPTLLLATVWASTALIQVPQHAKLSPHKAPALVRANWIRTIAWTTRLVLLASLHVTHS